jgi:DNA-binding PadR family transcriptional regulator
MVLHLMLPQPSQHGWGIFSTFFKKLIDINTKKCKYKIYQIDISYRYKRGVHMLEYVVLGMLMEGVMSGYDLKKTIDSSVGIFYKASFGSLYPALKRLSDKGMVSMTETGDTKNKKLYSLLPAGREAFLEWLAGSLQATRNEQLIRIFFFDYLKEEIRQQRMNEYFFNLEQQIRTLEAVKDIVAGELAELPNPEDYYYRVSVLAYGLNHFQMEKQWLKDIMERKALNHVEPKA